MWSAANSLALVLGPLLGALVVQAIGWRWIFLAEAPLAVVAVGATGLTGSKPVRGNDALGFDLPGVALSGLALLALVSGLTAASNGGFVSGVVVAELAVAAAAFWAFLRAERRRADALVDVGNLARRPVYGANAVMLLQTAIMCSVLYFVALYLQSALAYPPLGAGLRLLPFTVAILVASPIAGRLYDRLGARRLAVLGMTAVAFGLVSMAEIGLGQSSLALEASLAMIGVGIGLVTAPTAAVALAGAAKGQAGGPAALLTAARMIGPIGRDRADGRDRLGRLARGHFGQCSGASQVQGRPGPRVPRQRRSRRAHRVAGARNAPGAARRSHLRWTSPLLAVTRRVLPRCATRNGEALGIGRAPSQPLHAADPHCSCSLVRPRGGT